MPSAGIEPAIPAPKRPQTYALYRAAIGIGFVPINNALLTAWSKRLSDKTIINQKI
jgi:hypothetical protein